MRKVISLCVCVCIAIISVIGVGGVNQSVYASTDTFDYVDIIREFGLMDSENQIDFLGSEPVDREDAVRYVLNLKNIKNYSNSGKRSFRDISPYYAQYSMLDTAVDAGIIKPDPSGNFRPKDGVTIGEASAMILRAMGYEVLISSEGIVDENKYFALGQQYGLFRNVSLKEQVVTRETFARMIYNTFNMGIVELIGFGQRSEYTINRDKSSLFYLGLKKGEGLVKANEITHIYYSAQSTPFESVEIDAAVYMTGKTDISQYLGYKVEFYYYDDKNADFPEICYFQAKGNTVSTYPLMQGRYKAVGNRIYYTEDSGRKVSFELPPNTSMIINGKSVPYDLSYIVDCGSTGSFSIINNQSGGENNTLILKSFSNDIVSGVDLEEGVIYLTAGTYKEKPALPLPIDKNDNNITVTKNNAPATLEDIQQDDVISYAIDITESVVTIHASDKIVSGQLTEISIDGESFVRLGEEAYFLASDFHSKDMLVFGRNVELFLNYEKNVVFAKTKFAKNYAYVLDTAISEDVSRRGMVKLYTTGGTAEVYELANKVYVNGQSTPMTTENVLTLLNSTTAVDNKQLIVYTLNSKSEIDTIQTQQSPSGNPYDDQKKFVLSHVTNPQDYIVFTGFTFDGIGMKNTPIFEIPNKEDVDEKDCSVSIGGLVRGTNYRVAMKMYDVSFDGDAGAALLAQKSDGGYRISPIKSYMVTKFVDTLDREGLPIKKLYLVSEGAESSILISADAICIPMNDISVSVDALSFGDIILYETNNEGQLAKFSVLYQAQLKKPAVSQIYLGGDGVGYNRDILILKGTLRYKSADQITLQYQWKTGVGYEPFTYTKGFMVTKVDLANKKIGYKSIHSLIPTNFVGNIVGQEIIINSNRNKLTEVYIYE